MLELAKPLKIYRVESETIWVFCKSHYIDTAASFGESGFQESGPIGLRPAELKTCLTLSAIAKQKA
jgi:hypothetical protein